MDEILMTEYRGDILECINRGHIVIVDDKGKIVHEVGDGDFQAYFRSSAKPIQAIPFISRGLQEKFNLTDKELAILAASHRAEKEHVDVLVNVMNKIGIKDEEFICKPTYPLKEDEKIKLIKAGEEKKSIYHNCSGKHLGLMGLCLDMGEDMKNYWKKDSIIQKEILRYISYMADIDEGEIGIGVDGCGVPVFAAPLKNLATAYMKMACPEVIKHRKVRDSVIKITKVMNTYPKMISGTGLICSTLLEDENIIAKGGARGIYCFGLKKEKLGIAIKVMDGSEAPWPYIIISILEQLNYENKNTIKKLRDRFNSELVNDNNLIVGRRVCKFKL
ncbi:asparaginase [Oceanirhabdus seepicola]|uniref:Asparaginase n=1 Tax=Oceanirhabdus seepicola TaxID=2828781 RepID=A0A9J6P384_9CLOT|nr:asparaginase [Oceanirhabdus seepicola]MCM1991011.1 asparaginase [Oceanirhabdus seepicola]